MIFGGVQAGRMARSSLHKAAVKRSLWIVFLALLLLAAVALLRPDNTGDVVASLETSPPPLPDVTVRQEFVTVSVPAVRTRGVAMRNAGARPGRPGAPAAPPATNQAAPRAASSPGTPAL